MDSQGNLVGFGGQIWGWIIAGIVLVLVGFWVRHCRKRHEELRRHIRKFLEEPAAPGTKLKLREGELKEVMGLLCGKEFQLDYFAGINFAFYRAFVVPTIAGTAYRTGTLESHALKRVEDTDLMMHAWLDFGVKAEEAKRSFVRLTKIHGFFKIRNEDLLLLLCCFLVDVHKMNQLLGSRSFTQREKEANFLFWMEVGHSMDIQDLPLTLEEAERLVHGSMLDDRRSRVNEAGKVLTEAMTKLLVVQAQDVLSIFPESWVRSIISVLLFEVGGPVFHHKLGFEMIPSKPERFLVNSLFGLRAWFAWNLVPPPRTQHRLSEQLMRKNYGRSIHDPEAFLDVGPDNLTSTMKMKR